MGCSHSKDNKSDINKTDEYLKMLDATYSNTTCNEIELDRTHFSSTKMLLGIGGFGIVRLVEKITGEDQGTLYALKSLSKSAVLKVSELVRITSIPYIVIYAYTNVNTYTLHIYRDKMA